MSHLHSAQRQQITDLTSVLPFLLRVTFNRVFKHHDLSVFQGTEVFSARTADWIESVVTQRLLRWQRTRSCLADH